MPPKLKRVKHPQGHRMTRTRRIAPIFRQPKWDSANDPKKVILTVRKDAENWFKSSAGGILGQVIHVNDPSICSDWTSCANMFDCYRVDMVKVTYFPRFNEAYMGGAGLFAPVYLFYDADSTTTVTTVDDAIQYSNYKGKNLFMPWTYKAFPKPQTDNSVSNAGMAVTYDKAEGILLDTLGAANYQKGIIGWFADSLPFEVAFGDLIIDYHVTFFNRR